MSSPALVVSTTSVSTTSPVTVKAHKRKVLFWNIQNWHSTEAVSPKVNALCKLMLATGAHCAMLCECMESLGDLIIEERASNPSSARSTRGAGINENLLDVQASLKDQTEGLFRYEAYQPLRYANEGKSSADALGYATVGIQSKHCSIMSTTGYHNNIGRYVDTTKRRQLLRIDQPGHPLVFVVHMVAAESAAASQILYEIINLVIKEAKGRAWIIVGDMNVDADILAGKLKLEKDKDPCWKHVTIIKGSATHGHASGAAKILDYAIATADCGIEVVEASQIVDSSGKPTSDHLPIVLTYDI